jgi:predicted anti-sigma-YlaC factor YlaD
MTMPNHQPFRDWLFTEEPLSPADALLLQEHLRTCEACQKQRLAWNSVQHLLQTSGQVAPEAGFTTRWQSRLAAQRLKKQHKIAWGFFFSAAGSAFIILAVLGWLVADLVRTPQNLLLILFLRLAEFVTLVNSVGDYLSVMRVLIPSLPVVGLVFLTGFTCMISVLWLATFKRLSAARRVVE